MLIPFDISKANGDTKLRTRCYDLICKIVDIDVVKRPHRPIKYDIYYKDGRYQQTLCCDYRGLCNAAIGNCPEYYYNSLYHNHCTHDLMILVDD